MSKFRFGVLLFIQLLIIAHIVQWAITGRTLAPIEPSESMETVKYGVITVGFIFFTTALLSTAVLGRWFCGWGCHVVLLQDASAKLLNRFGIKPKPFRSRLLMLVPLILAFYMFLWPLVYRFVIAPIWGPDLTWPGFSVHLMTNDFWRSFPGMMVAIPFLFVCGFLVVYLMGMKGYCTYGCPYGGFFAPLDNLAVGRIRVTDDCDRCGECTRGCTSNVLIHKEVHEFGMVVDPGCMKCMDCVSICPNDALYFGMGPPAVAKPKSDRPGRRWDLSWPEEIVFGAIALTCFLSVRGAYGLIPLLFASGLTAVVVFICWKSWCCLRKPNVMFHSFSLKKGGTIRGGGYAFLGLTLAGCLLVLHTGTVTLSRHLADYHDGQVTTPAQVVFNSDSMQPEPAILEHARKARSWYEFSSWIGDGGIGIAWTTQAATDNRIAWLLAVERRMEEAEGVMRRSIERYGISPENAAGVGRILNARGEHQAAEEWYLSAIERLPQSFPLLDEWVAVLEADGRAWTAITFIRQRLETAPPVLAEWLGQEGSAPPAMIDEVRAVFAEQPWILAAIRRLSIMLMNHGQTPTELTESVELTERTLEAEPENPFAYRALALGYVKLDRLNDAVRALENSIRIEPDQVVFRYQLAELLNGMGRIAESEEQIRRARELEQASER